MIFFSQAEVKQSQAAEFSTFLRYMNEKMNTTIETAGLRLQRSTTRAMIDI